MVKYPLYVIFDTNIIDANKYDFSESGALALLGKYVSQGRIKVVLSNVVYNEVKRHLSCRAKEITSLLNNALKDIRKTTCDSFIGSIGYGERLAKQSIEEAQNKAIETFDTYINSLNPEILNTKGVDTEKIFEDYFNYKPPFEDNDKKRKEFPDAFIAEQIKKRFSNGEIIAIVSNDKGLKSACGNSKSYIFYNSLGELYNDISKSDEQYEYITKLVTVTKNNTICRMIKERVLNGDNVSITGQTIDKDGVIEGNEYDETNVEQVSKVSYTLHTIDQIADDKDIVTIKASAEVLAYCSYDDYDNAAWDSEEKKYVYVDTIELEEKHYVHFPVRVILYKESDDISIKLGNIVLGPSTRISKRNISYETYIQDIEDFNRQNCGLKLLGDYNDFLEDDFADSKMRNDICEQFERIQGIRYIYEEAYSIYDDLREIISNESTKSRITKLKQSMEGLLDANEEEELTQDDFESIRDWLNEKCKKIINRVYRIKKQMPYGISFGDSVEISDGSDDSYTLSIDELDDMDPEIGQEYKISVTLQGNDEVASGWIKLTVGYMNFDEDGGVADALDDEIEYFDEEILSLLRGIVTKYEKRANDVLNGAKRLREVMG